MKQDSIRIAADSQAKFNNNTAFCIGTGRMGLALQREYQQQLAMAQAEYKLAKENLASTDTLYRIGQQRHRIAAISQADLLTLKLDKVNAQNTLQNKASALKRAMFSLASFLNLDKNTQIELELPSRPSMMEIPVDEALRWGRSNNPQLLELKQNVLEAERSVDRTKKESRFNASVNASIGFNQVAENFGDVYHKPMQQDLVAVSVSIPLVDWGVRKGKYNMARNNLNVVKISARQDEISIEEEVIMTVSDFNIQQQLIASAEEALDLSILGFCLCGIGWVSTHSIAACQIESVADLTRLHGEIQYARYFSTCGGNDGYQ
mgnify:CR=1 FL=1